MDVPHRTMYFCNICKTNSDQSSHHQAHLMTQKHNDKKKCFESCLNAGFTFARFNGENPRYDMFERDTGIRFIVGDRYCRDAYRKWLVSHVLIEREFPGTIFPLSGINYSAEEDSNNSINSITLLNETLRIKSCNNHDVCSDEIENIVKNIENYDMDFFVNMIINSADASFVALMLYKHFHKVIYLKNVKHILVDNRSGKRMKFEDNCWAYRDVGNDSNISEIPKIIRNAITMVVCEILKRKQEGISHTSNEFLVLLERISNIQKSMFKENVMRELKRLFCI